MHTRIKTCGTTNVRTMQTIIKAELSPAPQCMPTLHLIQLVGWPWSNSQIDLMVWSFLLHAQKTGSNRNTDTHV